VQQPGVPIVVGGHTDIAARRAARYGDGFYPGVNTADHLKPLLAVLKDECAKLGRKPESIELTAGGAVLDLDAVRRFQDLGVSRLTIAPPAFDPEGLVKGLETFANQVIAKS
jgi:alkanesulfonate monooxygenase SsuD/methylene tetrahydromethanopterin reductase-like flavin-dependent oxidoreductase (luciferase family)